jgi:hypothetical protein
VRLGAAAATGLVVLSPWTAYNLGRFEQPVLLSAGTGNVMSAGACDTTYDGDRLGWFDTRCHVGRVAYQPDVDRSVQDSLMRAGAIDYTVDHLGRLPVVVAAREGRTWAFFRLGEQNEQQANAVDVPIWVVWVQTVVFWVSVPLAALGAMLLRRRRIPIYPLLTFPAVAVLTVAVTFGDVRYRAPAEIPLVLLVAAGAVLLVTDRRRGRAAGEMAGPGGADSESAMGHTVRRGTG